MALFLSEKDVASLIAMKEVVQAVEECFRRQASGSAVNSARTRTPSSGAVLNVMHASLPYLGRAGVKCYLSSGRGARFVFVLFRLDDAEPLAVMGADVLGRYRTGAASAVATRHLFRAKEFGFAVCGAGKQALTQVLAMREVASLSSVRLWSPHSDRRELLAKELGNQGFAASACDSLEDALSGAEVATAITSSKEPFLTPGLVRSVRHLNLCGSNMPSRAEATPECVGEFQTIVVDDIGQSKTEAGDLVAAEKEGRFSWDRAFELKDVVSGKVRRTGRTLFKSNGVAIEDVAAASLVYDRAVKEGGYAERSLGF
ncbi:MAG: ornithine cyclodeaminase family protein [Nitrososphaerota archaeon]|nr:ornithine cyclodeaminase family protein [Nitrososphaerota archaeon]